MSNVRPHVKIHRVVSVERSVRRFPPKAAHVLLFLAGGRGHRSTHIKAMSGLHSPPTVANRKHVSSQRWRLKRQREKMLATQLALPLCAAAALRHGQGCHCYA